MVDLVPETIIHVDSARNAALGGSPDPHVVEAPDVLERMFPREGIKEAVGAMAKRVAAADRLQVASDRHRSPLSDDGAVPVQQYGYAEEPGRWDHWPSAMVAAYPVDGTAEGTLSLAR